MLETLLNVNTAPAKGEFEIDIDPSRQDIGDLLLTDFGNRGIVFEAQKLNSTTSAGTGIVLHNGEKYYNPNGELGLVELGTKKMGFFEASSEITFEYIIRSTDPKAQRVIFSSGNYPSSVSLKVGCNITIDRPTGPNTMFFNVASASSHYNLLLGSDPRVMDTLCRYKLFYNAKGGMVKYRNDISGTETAWSNVGNKTESYFRLFGTHDKPNGVFGSSFLFKRLTLKYTDV